MNGHTMEVMPGLACDVLREVLRSRKVVEDDDDRQIGVLSLPTVSRLRPISTTDWSPIERESS